MKQLPITLLERHVITHIFCAILMYALWFEKPYDVGSPYICRYQRIVDVAALFALNTDDLVGCEDLKDNIAQKHTAELKAIKGLINTAEDKSEALELLHAAQRAIRILKIHGSNF